jgi:hypothetical protein
MECAVYDTYVKKKDGKIMHFDVVVADETSHEKAIEYGKQYLKSTGQMVRRYLRKNANFAISNKLLPL